MEFLRPTGAAFAGPQQAELAPWGEGTLEFTSCTTARLSYRSEVQSVEGSFDMVRITPNEFCTD